MFNRFALVFENFNASRMNQRGHFLFHCLKCNRNTWYLDTASRTAGAGADKHQNDQNRFGKWWPQIKICSRISRCCNNRCNLKRTVMDGLENRRIIFADIPGNQQDACCNNCQISPHFLTVKGILWFFDQEQVIYVKVNAKKDHGNT